MTEIQNLLANLTSGDDKQAQAAVKEIAAMGEMAIPTLKTLLSEPEPDTRWWAIRALAAIEHPEVANILHEAIHDPNPSVRQCAVLGLRQHPTPEPISDLIAYLHDADQLLARLAANALVTIGSDAVPSLLKVLENGPQNARLEAVKALAEIGDTRAVPAFFTAIRDGDSSLVEYWADIGLERMGIGMAFFKP